MYGWTHPVAQTSWSCRSSWNSVGHKTQSVGIATGGSLRVQGSHSYQAEHESLLSPPSLHPLHPPPPPLFSRHFVPCRDRRALSLELPELLQVPGAPPTSLDSYQCKKSFLEGQAGVGVEHQDCNGKTPAVQQQILSGVYPQVNTRKDRDLEDEINYVSQMRTEHL